MDDKDAEEEDVRKKWRSKEAKVEDRVKEARQATEQTAKKGGGRWMIGKREEEWRSRGSKVEGRCKNARQGRERQGVEGQGAGG